MHNQTAILFFYKGKDEIIKFANPIVTIQRITWSIV